MSKVKIALLVDRQFSASGIKKVLKNLGYGVYLKIYSGKTILEDIVKHKANLVIMDIRLAINYKSAEIAEIIQSQYNIPVIFIVTQPDYSILQQKISPVPFGYIIEPFDESLIQTAIEMAIYRHNTEMKYREDEEEYKKIFELSMDAIALLNTKGIITSCNEAATKISGYPKEEIVGKHFSKLGTLRENDISLLLKMFSELLKGKSPVPFEVLWKHKNGDLYYSEIKVTVLKKGGKISGFVTYARDITDRKRAGESIKEKTEELESIFKNAPLGFSYLDNEMRIIRISQFIEEKFGVKSDMIKHQHCYDVFGQYADDKSRKGKDRICDDCGVVKTLKDGKTNVHVRQLRDDYIIRSTSVPVKNEKGRVTGAVEIIEDITGLRKTEEALRESEEKFRNLVETATDAIISTDSEGNITFWNKAAERVFGYKDSEIIGKPVSCLIPEQGRDFFQNSIAQNGSDEQFSIINKVVELQGLRKDGAEFPAELSLSTWQSKRGRFYTAVVRDITDRKEMLKSLRESEQFSKQIIESSNDCIKVLDKDGRLLFMSRGGQNLMGIEDITPFLNKSWIDYWKGKDKKSAIHAIAQAKKGKISSFQGFCPTTKGEEKWWDVVISPIREREGKIDRLLSISRDITDSKIAEKEIQNKTKDLLLINNLNQALNKGKSLKDIVQLLSNETKRMFNCFGATVYLLNDEKDHLVMQNLTLPKEIARKIEKVIKMKIPEVKIPLKEGSIYRKILRDGKTRLINDPEEVRALMGEFTNNSILKKLIPEIYAILGYQSVINLPLVAEGEVIGLMDISRQKPFNESDLHRLELLASQFTLILDHRRVEEKIYKHTEFINNILKSLTHPFYVIDAHDYTIKLANPATGVPGKASATTCYSLTHKRDKPCSGSDHPCALKMVKKSKSAITVEHIHYDDDGNPRYVEVHGYPIFDEKGNVIQMIEYCLDITQRKKAEEEIRRSQKNLQTILSSMPFGVVTISKEKKILSANETALNLIGYEKEEQIVGKSCKEIFCITENGECPILDRGERIDRSEKMLMVRNGGYVPVLKSVISINIDSEEVFLETFVDIRERKQAEDELKKWANIFENSEWGVVVSSPDGKHLGMMNPAFARMHGYTVEELTGKPIVDVFAPESRADLIKNIRIAHERGHHTYESKHLRKDGTIFPVLIDITVVKDQEGNFLYRVVNVQDITKRKQAEATIRESEDKYRRLFEESKDVIFVNSVDGKILDLNPAGVELFGYSSIEEVRGKNIFEDFYLEPQEREVFQKEIERKGFVKDFELTLKRKDGEKFYIQETSSVIRNEKGEIVGYRGILRDITQQKVLKQQLLQAQKMEAMGVLAGGIAHDFNNILTTIIGNAQLGLMQIQPDHPLYKRFTDIEKTAHRAAALTKQILAFSRRQLLEPRVIDINELITDFSKMLRRLIGEHIKLNIITSEESCPVMADPNSLEQALMNFAVNARDAMPDGGTFTITTERLFPDDELKYRYSDLNSEEYAFISIADTGTGIPQKILSRIFEPFFTTKETGKGTGLGLSVVHGIIKQHNGVIDVESKLNEGTLFKIYLPITQSSPEEKTEKVNGEIPRGSETILIAEDESHLREMAEHIFQSLGYTVLTSRDGKEAVEIFKQNKDKIDLVILDIIMPRLGGKEASKEIRMICHDVPILFISGYSGEINGRINSDIKYVDLLPKPFTIQSLGAKVRKILDNSQKERK